MSTRNQNIITHLIQTISATFHTHPLRGLGGFLHPLWGLGGFCLLLLCACSDWNDMGTETIPDGVKAETQEVISFNGKVVSSQLPTRANATIVHLRETSLPATSESSFYAGIFGCHTEKYTWGELATGCQKAYTDYKARVGEAATAEGFLSSAEFNEFKNSDEGKAYTANLLFNAKAEIGSDGMLIYAPQRFWPNNLLPSPATGHEYCTFWAYYPYNPTAEIGDYGISITEERMGQGVGMGRVRFTMQPDAAEQNDFMISSPAVNCNRDLYPLVESPQGTYTPKPVTLYFYHMLAQVRLYAYIQGSDKMIYKDENGDGIADPADATWLSNLANGTHEIKDQYGNTYEIIKSESTITSITNKELNASYPSEGSLTEEKFLALGLKVPNENKCKRWTRQDIWDKTHTRRRALISYKMEFNNIKTTTTFFPDYSGGSPHISYEPASTLGSATVNDYIMNPYWFHFNDKGKRDYLSDEYMFGIFEDQAAWKTEDNALAYTLGEKNQVDKNDETKHYNFAPGNILLVVPQVLDDDDVPHIVLTATDRDKTEFTARLTINMLKMNIEWKSGYIYCYAILDDLRPGDDIVRGPESITSIFDTSQYTDQW